MGALKVLNLSIRFLLELFVLIAVGYWGFKTGTGWFFKVLLGIGLPALVAVIWGTFAAPKAAHRLHGLRLLGLEAAVFGSGVAALVATKNYSLAWAFAIIVILNRVLMFIWRQQLKFHPL